MAFYATEQSSSSSRSMEALHHPPFPRGFFPVPNYMPIEGLSLANYHSTTEIDYMCSLRPICEVLFYFLLLTYGAGVRACMLRSVGDGICPRESTPGWKEADNLASSARTQ